MNKRVVLFLSAELQGYNIPVFRELVQNFNCVVHVIHWDSRKLTPYVPDLVEDVFYYNRSEFKNRYNLQSFVFGLKAELVYICGWMDMGYLFCARKLRSQGIPVVSGFDDIYNGSYRQVIASLLFPLIRNKLFSHAWVAGHYQYEFAKRLGFRNELIIYNLLSADVESYHSSFKSFEKSKKSRYPHNFFYVGRFSEEKGIGLLLTAWSKLGDDKKDWKLKLIGNGMLKDSISVSDDLELLDYIQPMELPNLTKEMGCIIVPSITEPWSVTLHEFAAAGMPMIVSDVCGAVPFFVIDGFNSFIFNHSGIFSLEEALLKIINLSDAELFEMSRNSNSLGHRITPQMSASSFISLIR
jgi:glycosyltransferase involved in cell wall biosynthesis